MDKALKRRQSGPPCVSYPLWPGARGPVRIIVEGPSCHPSSRRSSRWSRRSSEASASIVLGKVVRKSRAFCRSLTPEPRLPLSAPESPEPSPVYGTSGFAFRAKSLSPAKRMNGDRSLGSTDDELDEPPFPSEFVDASSLHVHHRCYALLSLSMPNCLRAIASSPAVNFD